MSIIAKIDEAITHIADVHEDLQACMILEKAKRHVRELEQENAELKEAFKAYKEQKDESNQHSI